MDGLRILLMHGNLPACADCQAWLYDERWKRVTRGGQDQARPTGMKAPCWKCPKSADRQTPNPGAELSRKNWQAYDYYRQCLADTTGLLPRDRIVIKNNAIIALVEDHARQHDAQAPLEVLLSMLGRKGK